MKTWLKKLIKRWYMGFCDKWGRFRMRYLCEIGWHKINKGDHSSICRMCGQVFIHKIVEDCVSCPKNTKK